jgi:hypothetical protein
MSRGLAAFYKQLDKKHPAKKYARAKNADERGVWRDNNMSWHGGGGPKYDLLHPVTGKPCSVPADDAEEFMGPDIVALFRQEGAEVIADTSDLRAPGRGATLIAEAGHSTY